MGACTRGGIWGHRDGCGGSIEWAIEVGSRGCERGIRASLPENGMLAGPQGARKGTARAQQATSTTNNYTNGNSASLHRACSSVVKIGSRRPSGALRRAEFLCRRCLLSPDVQGCTVSSHNFNSTNRKLRVSHPRTIVCRHFKIQFESANIPQLDFELNSQVHKEFPRHSESTTLSLRILSLCIDRRAAAEVHM